MAKTTTINGALQRVLDLIAELDTGDPSRDGKFYNLALGDVKSGVEALKVELCWKPTEGCPATKPHKASEFTGHHSNPEAWAEKVNRVHYGLSE